VCEWPAAGIALSRAETDAQQLLDAAARAVALFPDEPPAGEQTTWSSTTTQLHSPDPAPDKSD
jgi:hypothetical protein